MKKTRLLVFLIIFLLLFSSCSNNAAPANTPDTIKQVSDVTSEETAESAPNDTLPEVPEPDDILNDVKISEIMVDNSGFYLMTMNEWVELYNGEEFDIKLDDYYLYTAADPSNKIFLDNYTVKADGFTVIKFDDSSEFRLNKSGGKIVLGYKSVSVDELEYDGNIGTFSWSHEGQCAHPTPGYPNNDEGYNAYLHSVTVPDLYISEVMSSNKKYAPVDGKYYDFVEICNGGTEAVNLSDYYLSDKRDNQKRYRLPEKQLLPSEYFIIYCSGLSLEGHAPFKISSSGEDVFLSNDGSVVDFVSVPSDLKQNESYGRSGNLFVYMDKPTPGKENNEGYTYALTAPTASLSSGYYDDPQTVELSGNGSIYYTLDGTEPGKKSTLYTGPIHVDGITSIRAVCVDGERTSAFSSYFYLVGIKHDYPVINIAIKQSYLTGDQGVLNNIDREYEHECYITMMDDGVECFSVPCGFKLHGNDSKKGAKQNFQIRFREKYGLGKLDYPLFDDRDYTEFNSLLLKGGSEDYKYAGFRDELCTTLVDGKTNLSILACRPVVLYLDGEYWGMYWLRERYDTLYCAHQLGVSKESINLLNTYGTVSAGSNEDYLALLQYCKSHDLRKQEYYDYVMNKIDHLSLMDWYICRSYVGDLDLANVRFYQSTEDDGKWHWCYFDLDWAFYHNTQQALAKGMPNNGKHVLILSLLKNPEFKDMFIKRYAELMRTVLNEESILESLDKFTKWMEPEVERDHAKYKLPLDKWSTHLDKIRDYVKDGLRQKNIIASIRNYFGLSDEEVDAYFHDLLTDQ